MRLWDDERAQSIQVGAVLLFGVLVILFSVYQAVIVPSQNQEVEFNHNQRVQGDMVELRNAVLETKSTGQDGFASVELGTQFPARLLGLNPPSPSGVLQTTAARPVVVRDASGSEITSQVCPGSDITTRTFEYTPSYSEFDNAGTIRYENSLVYHNYSENAVLLSGQQLIQPAPNSAVDGRIQLIPLNRSFREASSRTVSVDFKPGQLDTSQRDVDSITVPTRLPRSAWVDALSGQVDPANINVTTGASGRNLTLTLSGTYAIDCGPVGVDEAPESGGRESGSNGFNPAGPGDIRLVDENLGNNGNVTIFLNNSGGNNSFSEARINFYRSQTPNKPTEADLYADADDDTLPEIISPTLDVGGPFERLTPNIPLEGNGTETEVIVNFDRDPNPNDFFIITLELETGETATYFVPAR
ncbi:hypothetical protein [Salinirussus salinus]|uniref:hypothetical protein n=1 Tax=Salinirussus salinus TaxID=1198300 RepID=UPI001359FDD1|nr:hypothetical protein [Salinirussus salinus]